MLRALLGNRRVVAVLVRPAELLLARAAVGARHAAKRVAALAQRNNLFADQRQLSNRARV